MSKAPSIATANESPGEPHSTIKVRRMDLAFPDSMPTFWADDNPLLTAVLSSLSVSFPPGERYFIASVKHYLPRIDDAALRAAVQGFIGQEGQHTKEHIAFNRFLDTKGFPAAAMEKFVSDRIGRIQKMSKPEANLARTVALEHFTAILAGALLQHLDTMEKLGPEAAKLWVWHAIEEIEHKSVAFDVYKSTVDDEALRVRTMVVVTALFTVVNIVRTAWILKVSGRLFDLRAHAKGLDTLFGRAGLFRNLLPHYLAYYRRDFHPSHIDQSACLERAKRKYLGEAA